MDRALRVLRFKSAKYTVERPLHIGAALAGGTPELLAALSAYGLPVGEAFQLRDDLLGVFGDPAVTGKPAGDDLREGKRTVLVAYAVDHASEVQLAEFDKLFLPAGPGRRRDPALREILIDSRAVDACEDLIAHRTEAAADARDAPFVDEAARTALADLAVAATVRSV